MYFIDILYRENQDALIFLCSARFFCLASLSDPVASVSMPHVLVVAPLSWLVQLVLTLDGGNACAITMFSADVEASDVLTDFCPERFRAK